MKAVVLLLVVAVTSVYASYDGHYYPGFQHAANGIVSAYRNDQRQIHVNRVADYIGSGIGTGRFYGVPGTNGHYRNYGYGYGHNGYNHGHNGYHGGHGGYAKEGKEADYHGTEYAGNGYAGQAYY